MINHLGRLFVTSDAATIIREIEVVHPAAKLLVMASQAQESEVSLSSLRSGGSPGGLRGLGEKERAIHLSARWHYASSNKSRLWGELLRLGSQTAPSIPPPTLNNLGP